MSKAAEELAVRAARALTRAPEAEQDGEDVPAPRALPVRISIDLSPVAHRGLISACMAAAGTLQVPKVSAVSVIRALLVALERDPDLAREILPDVRRDVEENRRRK